MSKKSNTFASDYDIDDPVGTLAYTDFSKPIPILEGEDAERFIKNMEENERKAEEAKNKPITKEEAEKMLSFKKIMLEYEKSNIKNIEKEIKKLEEIINN